MLLKLWRTVWGERRVTRVNRSGTLWEGPNWARLLPKIQGRQGRRQAVAGGRSSEAEADKNGFGRFFAGSDVLGQRTDQGMYNDPGHDVMHLPYGGRRSGWSAR